MLIFAMTLNLSEYRQFAKDFILSAGAKALAAYGNVTIAKTEDGGRNVSTNLDQEIEQAFSELVLKTYPDHGFQGEEFKELNRPGELMWYIDPIDGTKWFAKEVPLWCVVIALVQGDKPIVGLIYNPVSGQLYEATLGGGALLNDKKIAVMSETDPSRVQVSFDFSVSDKVVDLYDADFAAASECSWNEYRQDVYMNLIKLHNISYRVRDIGSGALALAWLAQGFFGGYVSPLNHKDKIVDISAGLLIAQEAGARVQFLKLSPNLHAIFVGATPELLTVYSNLFKAD